MGTYRIYTKLRYDVREPGYPRRSVPYPMYFCRGHGIHGACWHNRFGQPMSHRCITLPTPGVAWLFDCASIGILVSIHS